MKTTLSLILIVFFIIFTFTPNTSAQDYTKWALPEGAKTRLGKGRFVDFAYLPDSSHLAIVTRIGIWIYDAQTGEELDLLTGLKRLWAPVVFSLDGNTLAWSWDDTVRLWDVDTGTQLQTLTGHTSGVNSVAFSPDGRTLASGSWDDTVRLWDVETGNELRTLIGHADWVNSVAFSPDGNTIASGSDDKTVRLWDVDTGTQLQTLAHTGWVSSVAFSPDGGTLASGSSDNTVRLWDAETGIELQTLTGHAGAVRSVAFSPDGGTLASGSSDNTVRLWDAETGIELQTLTGHAGAVRSVAFSPDGNTIASRSWDDTVRLWDAETGTHLRTLAHTGGVSSIAFSPDGNTIASGDSDETVRLWDAETGTHLRTLTGHMTWSERLGDSNTFTVYGSVRSVSFSPDGSTLASGGGDRTIRLWEAETGIELRTLTGHERKVNSVAFSPDGNTIASGSDDRTIRLWEAETGIELRTLTGHADGVNSVAFSPDGNTIASGSDDKTVRLWDVDTGRHLRTLTGHAGGVTSVAFSPDGNTIASAGGWWDDTVRLWEAETGRHLRTLAHTGWVSSVTFSPDSSTLASGSSADIVLWDVDTGTELRTLTGHADGVTSVAFSPDGNTIASGSSDSTVLLWELMPSATTNTIVSFSPGSAQSPPIGQQLTFSLKIADAENVAGYQATVSFDTTALRYVESANGDYLPSGAFFIPPIAEGNTVTLAASSLAGESAGDGTLATLTFEVIAAKASTVRLTDVLLTDSSGGSSVPQIEHAEITEPPQLPADVNQDGVVNIIDLTLVASNFGATGQNAADVNSDGVVNIIDLTLVAAAFGNTAAAPEIWSLNLDTLTTREEIEQWLNEARQVNLTDPTFQRGLIVLEQLLATLTPKETALLPNYPNPFNPETWIPYQLSEPADVSISIYAIDGQLVRTLTLGHQPIGIYESRSRAAYWDGKNALGEPIASGVYFYTLTAGDFTATRKMLIRK